jgi:hypothetical protein
VDLDFHKHKGENNMRLVFSTTIKQKPQVLTCEAIMVALNPTESRYSPPVSFLELVGSASTTRAMWAHLVKRRTEDRVVNTDIIMQLPSGDTALQVMPRTKYGTRAIGKSFFIIDIRYMDKMRKYMIGGSYEDPNRYFMDALRINVPELPVLPEWKVALWKKGIDMGGIVPQIVHGNDTNAWTIENEGKVWNKILKEVVNTWHN